MTGAGAERTGQADTAAATARPGLLLRMLVRTLAGAGAGISLYLLFVALATHGLPAGCGAGSGCAAVLASRWAGSFGAPVSAPALLGYAAVLIASAFLGPRSAPGRRAAAWSLLTAIAVATLGAAVWFIALQALVLRAFCPWCMADHAIGLALAVVVLGAALRPRDVTTTTGADGDAPARARPRPRRSGPVAAGTLAVGALIAGQFLVAYSPTQIQRLPAGVDADSGPGPGRAVQLLDGRLRLVAHEDPMIGSPEAEHLVVVLLDYCCPHCRVTHEYLLGAVAAWPEQLALLPLPMPMNADCNPDILETEPRFEHACALARLALAVRRADPGAFPIFDAWLFEPEEPRHPAEARARAVELVGAAALESALRDPWIEEAINRSTSAYVQSGATRIPVIMAVGMASIVGRPESEEELLAVLERDLHLDRTRPPH